MGKKHQATKIGHVVEETSLSRTALSIFALGAIGLMIHVLLISV
jgi:hypothetical protein